MTQACFHQQARNIKGIKETVSTENPILNIFWLIAGPCSFESILISFNLLGILQKGIGSVDISFKKAQTKILNHYLFSTTLFRLALRVFNSEYQIVFRIISNATGISTSSVLYKQFKIFTPFTVLFLV
jgi:hypothetical protein